MRGKRVLEKDGGGETNKSDGEGREGKEVRTQGGGSKGPDYKSADK